MLAMMVGRIYTPMMTPALMQVDRVDKMDTPLVVVVVPLLLYYKDYTPLVFGKMAHR